MITKVEAIEYVENIIEQGGYEGWLLDEEIEQLYKAISILKGGE